MCVCERARRGVWKSGGGGGAACGERSIKGPRAAAVVDRGGLRGRWEGGAGAQRGPRPAVNPSLRAQCPSARDHAPARLTAGGLVEVHVDALQLQVRVASVRAGGVDAMLVADDLVVFGGVGEEWAQQHATFEAGQARAAAKWDRPPTRLKGFMRPLSNAICGARGRPAAAGARSPHTTQRQLQARRQATQQGRRPRNTRHNTHAPPRTWHRSGCRTGQLWWWSKRGSGAGEAERGTQRARESARAPAKRGRGSSRLLNTRHRPRAGLGDSPWM